HRGRERREDRRARVVLGGDQPERRPLALQLIRDRARDLRVGRAQLVPRRGVVVHLNSPRSIAATCSRRATCLPSSNSVSSHTFAISRASPNATIRPPIAKTLASLCWRESRAV